MSTASADRILLAPAPGVAGGAPVKPAPRTELRDWLRLAGLTGWALLLISIANLALLWYRPQFGTAGWEFAIIGQTFDRMPVLAIGLLLAAGGALGSASPKVMRLVAFLFGLSALVCLAMLALFTLASLTGWKEATGAAPEAISMFKRTIARGWLGGLSFAVLFAASAALLLRIDRARR